MMNENTNKLDSKENNEEVPQIKIIFSLLIAVGIFYTFGYTKVINDQNNMIQSLFRFSIAFMLGVIALFFYSYNHIRWGNFFYFFFIITLLSIVAGWFLFAGGFLDIDNDTKNNERVILNIWTNGNREINQEGRENAPKIKWDNTNKYLKVYENHKRYFWPTLFFLIVYMYLKHKDIRDFLKHNKKGIYLVLLILLLICLLAIGYIEIRS